MSRKWTFGEGLVIFWLAFMALLACGLGGCKDGGAPDASAVYPPADMAIAPQKESDDGLDILIFYMVMTSGSND